METFWSKKNAILFQLEIFVDKVGLKKWFVCRHPTDPKLEVPTQNILLKPLLEGGSN